MVTRTGSDCSGRLATKPEEFAVYQKSEQERWFKIIKENDIKGD
jgi:hypothetical protein